MVHFYCARQTPMTTRAYMRNGLFCLCRSPRSYMQLCVLTFPLCCGVCSGFVYLNCWGGMSWLYVAWKHPSLIWVDVAVPLNSLTSSWVQQRFLFSWSKKHSRENTSIRSRSCVYTSKVVCSSSPGRGSKVMVSLCEDTWWTKCSRVAVGRAAKPVS